ncbi:hypothetical protein SPHINGO361_100056 [Sphingomonas sp. EC-HK361]|nr:hypothetical protein SPHINGO361_100056 [Sphingomonas sp. EC-HK361]
MELPSTEQLPEEFSKSVPIQRFHRFAMVRDKGVTRVHFGLLGTDNVNNYFVADLSAMNTIALEFQSLAANANQTAPTAEVQGIQIAFDTVMAFAGNYLGGDGIAACEFRFISPTGNQFVTIIGPNLAAELAGSLAEALAALPQPPVVNRTKISEAFNVNVPGEPHSSGEISTYFGQDYDTAILKALGVLVVRANLLEKSMIRLLAKLAGISQKKASSLFYSTVNMGARIDMIRSLMDSVPDEDKKIRINKALDKTRAATGRRNSLIHGDWEFKRGKFEVSSFEPNKKEKRKVQTVTHKSVELLASDYRVAGMLLEAEAHGL